MKYLHILGTRQVPVAITAVRAGLIVNATHLYALSARTRVNISTWGHRSISIVRIWYTME